MSMFSWVRKQMRERVNAPKRNKNDYVLDENKSTLLLAVYKHPTKKRHFQNVEGDTLWV